MIREGVSHRRGTASRCIRCMLPEVGYMCEWELVSPLLFDGGSWGRVLGVVVLW